MKRRIVTVLVALCLVICAVPMMVFADEDSNTTKVTSLSFELNGYEVGESVTDTTTEVTSGAEALYDYNSEYSRSPIISTAGDTLDNFLRGLIYKSSDTDIAQDTDYYLGIMLRPADGYDLSSLEASNVTVEVGSKTLTASFVEKYAGIGYVAVFKLPQFESTVTYEIPITKTVTLGGNTAPGKTTFEFELINEYGKEYTAEELAKSGISYTASVTVTGAGTYTGKLVITGKTEAVENFLDYGFIIREKKQSDSEWTCDDSYWAITTYFDDKEYDSPIAVKGTLDTEAGLFTADPSTQSDGPSYTNVYTKNTDSPKTGDESNLGLWMALVLMSGAALAGTTVVFKKKANK